MRSPVANGRRCVGVQQFGMNFVGYSHNIEKHWDHIDAFRQYEIMYWPRVRNYSMHVLHA